MNTINSIAPRAGSMPANSSKRFKIISISVLLSALLIWAVASIFTAQDPHAQNLSATLQTPSAAHWLGTDHLGRDVLSRLAEAVRISLGLALASALLAVCLGGALGLLAAWRGGAIARACSLLADAVSAIPALLWVLLIAALAPGEKWALYSGLVLTAWVEFFRYVRPTARGILLGDAVQAGRLLGFGSGYVLRWHVWPALSATLLRLTSYAVASAVLAVAALGFVGIGLRPPTAELGLMMTEALPYYDEAPWLLAAPVLLLLGVVMLLQSGAALLAGQEDAA
ncbi:ABC transporter permease subunit [Variovorax sp. PCZ-1]|uniref:ABC transporter permease n=1 Tax=Variovorax sp. PCZ-1 TaxID=2835533 RepID=UPI001BCD755D|nr:ABC transporter permease subunit [Variovorax sp. PCZ-1]MBS7807219.1 ABC transporter permease [Variovorax sp. PCZ-1]